MTPAQYLHSLIEGQKISSIPVQLSELEFLMKLIQSDKTPITRSLVELAGDMIESNKKRIFSDD